MYVYIYIYIYYTVHHVCHHCIYIYIYIYIYNDDTYVAAEGAHALGSGMPRSADGTKQSLSLVCAP